MSPEQLPWVVGIDLAWGETARSGVALIDPSGSLRAVTSGVSDEEIHRVVEPFLDLRHAPCVVAVDAPLIVTNPTGRRDCEARLSRAFRKQHAGTHPTNLGLPWLAGGGRAARLARRYRLDTDATVPAAAGQRRAIEVYPHSTTVAVFELDQVLKYKPKPGRPLDAIRGELLLLTDLLASLGPPLPPLPDPDGLLKQARDAILVAPTKAALKRLEDPLDAVLCAYTGLLFLAGLTCVIGDATSGAIVTPARERHLEALGCGPACRPLPA